LLEAIPCRLAEQFLKEFDVRIRQSLWTWSHREHFADCSKFSWRRADTLRTLRRFPLP
jgi:hypothetical protein